MAKMDVFLRPLCPPQVLVDAVTVNICMHIVIVEYTVVVEKRYHGLRIILIQRTTGTILGYEHHWNVGKSARLDRLPEERKFLTVSVFTPLKL